MSRVVEHTIISPQAKRTARFCSVQRRKNRPRVSFSSITCCFEKMTQCLWACCCSQHSDSNSPLQRLFWGFSEAGHMRVTNSVQHRGGIYVRASGGNQGTELQDINSSGCSLPGHVFLPCSWVFHVMLWGALSSKAQIRKLHRGDLKPSCEQIKKKKDSLHPFAIFLPWEMPLWLLEDGQWPSVGTCQSSQPVGSEDIFLESHAQVLQRPGGECEDQKTPFTEKPVACAPLEVKSETRTRMWRLLVHTGNLLGYQMACHFSCLQNPAVIMTENLYTNLVANILTTKIRSFSFRRRKDKQHPFWIWVYHLLHTC